MQQLSNSIFENIDRESLQTDVREQGRAFPGSRSNGTQLLSGWKEIANYMHQGVRTVQRWERIGLPVRRVRKSGPSPVLALPEDLDAWARSVHCPLLDRIEELSATVSSLEAEVRLLKRRLRVRERPAQADGTSGLRASTRRSENCASGSSSRRRSNGSSGAILNHGYGRHERIEERAVA